jgi:glucuronoarabinoxylan endo-1,4-beta-xylanase
MKDNNSSIEGHLLTSQYAAYATYLANAAQTIGLDFVSFQNEPDITVTYQSCFWSPQQMETFMDNNASAIGKPVVMPESFQFDDSYSDASLNDATAVQQIGYVGGHFYGAGNVVHTNALNHGKHVWMTEHFNDGQDLATAMIDAKEVSDAMNNQFSAYIWWHAYHATLTDLDLINVSTPLLNGSAIGQFSHWIRPGMVRCSSTYNPQGAIYVTAYHNPGLVIVALNTGTAPVQQAFSLQNVTASALVPYQTGGPYGRQMRLLDSAAVSGNAFTYTLPPNSVTTFVSYDGIAPVILAQPSGETVYPDSAFRLSVRAGGQGNTYQWYKDGNALSAQTQDTLLVSNATTANSGGYSVVVTNAYGHVTSSTATITVEASATRLVNLSCRTELSANQIVTVGFFIQGTGTKQVLIRVDGPSLSNFGVSDALPDPQLKLFDMHQALLQTNSQWDPSLSSTFSQVFAFAYPAGSHDAAILATLTAGQGYTVQASSVSGAAGTVLVETYDADTGTPADYLSNLSARGDVGGSAANLTLGFSLVGTGQRTVLIRGVGPTLMGYSVSDAISDPRLTLFDSTSTAIESNFGWSTAPSPTALAATFTEVGAFAFTTPADAAMQDTLAPGTYTVQITSASGSNGEALAEIYQAP